MNNQSPRPIGTLLNQITHGVHRCALDAHLSSPQYRLTSDYKTSHTEHTNIIIWLFHFQHTKCAIIMIYPLTKQRTTRINKYQSETLAELTDLPTSHNDQIRDHCPVFYIQRESIKLSHSLSSIAISFFTKLYSIQIH